MEIVGGFMVMMSIIGFFLAVVWLVMPFVVFAVKGKQDRTLEVMESIEKRMSNLENRLDVLLAEQKNINKSAAYIPDSTENDADKNNLDALGTL